MMDDNQARMFFCDGVDERYSLVADPALQDADRLWREWLELHDRRVERKLLDSRLPDTPGLWRDANGGAWLAWYDVRDGLLARSLDDDDSDTFIIRDWRPEDSTPFSPLALVATDVVSDDMYRPGLFRDKTGNIWRQIRREDDVFEARLIAYKYGWQWGELDDPSGCGPFTLMRLDDMDWARPRS